MPSNRPLIALRLEQALYEKVAAKAKQEGRSHSNFVEHLVRRAMQEKQPPKR